jgi:uncharacterized protein YuzE
MSLTVAGIEFENHVYDERADVLYLAVAGYDAGGLPPHARATPEGHGIEFDEDGRVIALTLVNVRFLLDRDGELVITWPAGHVAAGDLAGALVPAA